MSLFGSALEASHEWLPRARPENPRLNVLSQEAEESTFFGEVHVGGTCSCPTLTMFLQPVPVVWL